MYGIFEASTLKSKQLVVQLRTEMRYNTHSTARGSQDVRSSCHLILNIETDQLVIKLNPNVFSRPEILI